MKLFFLIFIAFASVTLYSGCTPSEQSGKISQVKKNKKNDIPINGELVYIQHCKECHQLDGNGTPEIYPTLVNSDYINGDKELLIEILLNGLKKEIIVHGIEYNGEMPKADFLTNKEMAALINYIRISFNKKLPVVSDDDVARSRIRLRMKKQD